jgi:hypothetical protein
VPQLQVLRAARGAGPVEPASVLLPTAYGQVKVDVLEVRQIEIDQPGDDPGDRLHAFAHAWASDSATGVTIEVAPLSGAHVEVSALVAEPGLLVAMKLQAIMNRAAARQGTGLQDIARLILDGQARPAALAQLASCDTPAAAGIALHVGLWLVDRRRQALRWIHDAGGTDLTLDDLDLVAELLLTACAKLARPARRGTTGFAREPRSANCSSNQGLEPALLTIRSAMRPEAFPHDSESPAVCMHAGFV